jgi:hypothetical protein
MVDQNYYQNHTEKTCNCEISVDGGWESHIDHIGARFITMDFLSREVVSDEPLDNIILTCHYKGEDCREQIPDIEEGQSAEHFHQATMGYYCDKHWPMIEEWARKNLPNQAYHNYGREMATRD